MPLWIKIAIIAVLGIGLSIGSYIFVGQKLDAEHEQYVRGLVITHSAPSKDAIVIGEEPEDSAATSTEAAIDILIQGQQTLAGEQNPEDDSAGLVRKRIEHSDLSIEIGIVTFDDVEFQVGESWQSKDGQETYTITKIVKTPKQIQLYYETKNGIEYVFVLDEDDDGGYVIQDAENITVSVDTDPNGVDTNPESTETNQTSTTTQNTNTSTSTASTSTSTAPVIDTAPTTTGEQAQPYNDGTYQYKANPDFVPYTPPLYDRDYGAEVGIEP